MDRDGWLDAVQISKKIAEIVFAEIREGGQLPRQLSASTSDILRRIYQPLLLWVDTHMAPFATGRQPFRAAIFENRL